MPKAAQKRERLSVCGQSRAEFFGEINYYPNDFQELIHAAMDEHRFVYARTLRREGLTTGLVFEALWQAQRDDAQVVLVSSNFVMQMIHRRMLLDFINNRDRLWSEFVAFKWLEEFRFTGGRSIVSATVSTVRGLLGRSLTAVLYDDAERGSAWPWTELENILRKTGGCALIGAHFGNGYWEWIDEWREAANPKEIIYPPSQGYGGQARNRRRRDRGNDDGY